MRDIRDYIASEHPESTGEHLASPFNIVAERMALANFTQEEISGLYRQRTEATGQVFDDDASSGPGAGPKASLGLSAP
jgi:hypothetical protein